VFADCPWACGAVALPQNAQTALDTGVGSSFEPRSASQRASFVREGDRLSTGAESAAADGFLRFQEEYNQIRPHEPLQYGTPASRYVGSERRYPAKLPGLEYPPGAHLRRVSHHGDVKLDGVQMFVSRLLAWEVVGLLELEQDPNWLEVYYGPLIIRWMDVKRLRLVRSAQGDDGDERTSLEWGLCRQTPGTFRFRARIPGPQERDDSLSRNPGC